MPSEIHNSNLGLQVDNIADNADESEEATGNRIRPNLTLRSFFLCSTFQTFVILT